MPSKKVTKIEEKAPIKKTFQISDLSTLQSLTIVMVFLFLMFMAQQMTSLNNKVEEFGIPQDQQAMQEPLSTAAPYKPTATMAVVDPDKTPFVINYEPFIYTGFEMKYRGGSPLSSCPYRWVSVRDTPSIYGNVVGCLAPYSKWNVETVVNGQDALVYENGNVWGVLAMQSEDRSGKKWIALKYNGTEFTNWHGQ
jgi:hypothetical protein